MGRAKRIDENQPAIVKALEDSGCTVQSLSAMGVGVPDLIVGRAGANYFIEIKNPDKPKADRQLNPTQVKWHDNWKGQCDVAYTVDDALRIVRLKKRMTPL